MQVNRKNGICKRLGGVSKQRLSVVATCLLGAAASPLQAGENGMTIYGIVDVGLMHQSRTVGNGGSQTSMETSGISPSILGFRGTRDLGKGLGAFINLEAHFDANNGAFHSGGDGLVKGKDWLFRRQSNVGLSGDWGSLTLGRQYGPALLAHLGTEPRSMKENFSNLFSWAYTQLVTTSIPATSPANGTGAFGTNTNNDVGVFFNNAIQFRSKLGPVDYGVMYALGNEPGDSSKNDVFALGATYHGPVILSGSYEVMRDKFSGNRLMQHSGFGVAVPHGNLTYKGNYYIAKGDNSAGVDLFDVRSLGVGVDWKWNSNNSATLAYYHNKDHMNTANETRSWVLSNDYSWNKETTFYAQAAFVDAGSGATGLNGLLTTIVASGNATGRTSFVNVGLNYKF